jgi:hypothetical protein
MGLTISAYVRHAADVRTVRQIHAVTIAICEDPHTSQHLKTASAALTRKIEQILELPIASAPFLASIWRDFRALKSFLEEEDCKCGIGRTAVQRQAPVRQLPRGKSGLANSQFRPAGKVLDEKG